MKYSYNIKFSDIYLILGAFIIVSFMGYLLYYTSNFQKEPYKSYLQIAPYLGESKYSYNPSIDNDKSNKILYTIEFPNNFDKNNKLYELTKYDNLQIGNNQINDVQKYIIARNDRYLRYILNDGIYSFIYVDDRMTENDNKNNKLTTSLYINNGNQLIKQSDVIIKPNFEFIS